ncbi:hypothetical protein CYY_000595 [Polysphondylium violaceum]|uniref:Uncharacterized protein n=1 Tax=Polysphondylium violaceum TaxID=133409 RepID=A0A8J4Q3E4_9MYCE|nr:hypothetical protein CYY_000595 [Polysphondylium violaceum]
MDDSVLFDNFIDSANLESNLINIKIHSPSLPPYIKPEPQDTPSTTFFNNNSHNNNNSNNNNSSSNNSNPTTTTSTNTNNFNTSFLNNTNGINNLGNSLQNINLPALLSLPTQQQILSSIPTPTDIQNSATESIQTLLSTSSFNPNSLYSYYSSSTGQNNNGADSGLQNSISTDSGSNTQFCETSPSMMINSVHHQFINQQLQQQQHQHHNQIQNQQLNNYQQQQQNRSIYIHSNNQQQQNNNVVISTPDQQQTQNVQQQNHIPNHLHLQNHHLQPQLQIPQQNQNIQQQNIQQQNIQQQIQQQFQLQQQQQQLQQQQQQQQQQHLQLQQQQQQQQQNSQQNSQQNTISIHNPLFHELISDNIAPYLLNSGSNSTTPSLSDISSPMSSPKIIMTNPQTTTTTTTTTTNKNTTSLINNSTTTSSSSTTIDPLATKQDSTQGFLSATQIPVLINGELSIVIEQQPPSDVRTRTPNDKRVFSTVIRVIGDLEKNHVGGVVIQLAYANSANSERPSQFILGGNKVGTIGKDGKVDFEGLTMTEASTKHRENEFCLEYILISTDNRILSTSNGPYIKRSRPFYAYSNQKVLSRRRNVTLRTLSSTRGTTLGGEQMHVVGSPFIRCSSLKCIIHTPQGDVPASNIELYSESVLFFTLPPYPIPANFSQPEGTELPVQIVVTNDGRNYSNPLSFTYIYEGTGQKRLRSRF